MASCLKKNDGASESTVESGVDTPIAFGARKPIGLAKNAILPNVYAPWGKSKLHIEAAHFYLASMKRSPGRVEFELAFRGFVDAIFAFWNAFSKADGVAASPQFVTWLAKPIQDRKSDEVLQYLVAVRNKYQHDPLFKLQWTESKVQITSREGSMTLQGLRIFPDGTFEPKARSSAGGNATVELLENPGDPVLPTIVDTRTKPPKTYKPPQLHLGKPVNGTDPREMAALGLAYYEQCFQEAIGRFG